MAKSSARLPPHPTTYSLSTSSSSSQIRVRGTPPKQVYAPERPSPLTRSSTAPSASRSGSFRSGSAPRQLQRSGSAPRQTQQPQRSGSAPRQRTYSGDHPPNLHQRSISFASQPLHHHHPHHRRTQSATKPRTSSQSLYDKSLQLPHALSSDNVSHDLTSSVQSSDYSTQSAPNPGSPSPLSKKYTIECFPEKREPSPVSFASIKRAPSREFSLDGSEGSERQYIRATRKIVEELSRAQGAARRVAAVTSACEAFDHHDENRHNIELMNGAVQVLAKMLDQSRTTDDELRMICSALEMVLRGSPSSITLSYQKANVNFLSCMLRMLDRCEERTVKHADISILNITKMIFYLSKCPDLRVTLCRHPDVPRFLSRVATIALNPDCRALRVKIVANLATAEKNRVILLENNAIVDGLLRIAHMDSFDLARQNAAVALQELAASTQNHKPMANNDQLLGVLVKMALVEKTLLARDAVISALQTLAFTKQNRLRLVTFKDGVVLEALKRTLSVDPDEKIRRRAAGTLTNLACDETAEAMGSHRGLLEALAIICTKDYNSDVQTRAALALTKIGSGINCNMPCFETLLDALVVASLSKTSTGVAAVLRLKAREPENRQVMAQHKGVLDTLSDICVLEIGKSVDRDNSMRAIMHLVNDDHNRISMCNKVILDTLVTCANFDAEDQADCRDSAIRALERLATEASNRPAMARHHGLLQSVAKAVEREAKLQDDNVESEHGYLAKPLLMTLLLAM